MPSNATDLIDRYCAVWNEPDDARRATLLHGLWANGATYTDPRANTTSAEELLAHIVRVRASRPGARIVRTTAVDSHHGIARFGWRVVEADGTELPEGLDIAMFSQDDSRIESIIGFFGSLQPAK